MITKSSDNSRAIRYVFLKTNLLSESPFNEKKYNIVPVIFVLIKVPNISIRI